LSDAARFYGSAPELEKQLDVPPLPDGVRELWETFWRLSLSRPRTEGGFGFIPLSEIVAYGRLHNVRFTSWEVDTLQLIDALWLKDSLKHQSEMREAEKEKRNAGR
jgi:hypothetical protein